MKCQISLVVPTQGSLYNVPLCGMGTPTSLHSSLVISLAVVKRLDN